MSTELTIPAQGIQLRSLSELAELAGTVHRSKLAPKDLASPEAVMVAMQYGMELGLSPMQAVQSVAVINGRPVIWGDAALAVVKAHPECEDVIETFENGDTEETKRAVCKVLRRGKQPVTHTFSVKDAIRAKLWEKAGPWSQYPRRMLQMRARAFAIRDAFPDALRGVGVSEEVQDIPRANVREVPKEIPGLTFADEPAALPAEAAPREPSDNDGEISEIGEERTW